MKIDPKKFFISLIIFFSVIIVSGYYHFSREQASILHNLDTTLQRAVDSAHILLNDTYQVQFIETNRSEKQTADTIRSLTDLAKAEGVENIYSIILDSNNTYRISGKSLLAENSELYKDKNLQQAFRSGISQWSGNDEKGIRTLYAPFVSSNGFRYVIAADIRTNEIRKLSNAAAFKTIAASLVLLVGALPMLLIYRSMMQRTADLLRKEVIEAIDELKEVNDILENKVEEKTKELISQSFEDTLTKLPNRHRLQYDMDRSSYNALLILNLHNFREINDFFGTSIGDDLLRQMGHWLETLNQKPYRLSGDEFALLLNDANLKNPTDIEIFVHHLIQRLDQHPFSVGEESVALSVTIGIDAQTNVDLSLSHADIALHQAKETSKHYAFYNPESQIEERYKQNIAITNTIHKALNSGRIICYYQPIVSTQSGRIEKYETLVRMIDESANIIPPMDFLKIAQKTRIYPQITQTVIMQACNAFKERNEEFSVNLSIRDITDTATVRFIEEMIVQTDTAHRIVFEILESEGIENFEAVIRFTQRMRSLGAKIAIDDFGTGYSSLENILKLEVDFIKIDGSLIQNISLDPKHAIVVESIASFASKLGAKTIAEFVSSEEVFQHVKGIGITYSQGFYTGKPAPLSL